MKFVSYILLSCFQIFAVLPAHSQEAEGVSLAELDTLTGRWIELRGRIAEESRLWQNRRTRWEEEIRLLREESEVLRKELEAGREFMTSYEAERAEQKARAEKAEAELKELENVVENSTRELIRLSSRIPDSLAASLPVRAEELKADRSGSRTRAAQELLAYLSGLEAMQNRFHVVRERIETGGQHRQVDVLYLGLAVAWAVAPDGSWAGIGTPGETGWVWMEGGVDPLRVEKALQVHNRQITAELVPLPLEVKSGDGS